ncbi:antibiotic biosynthesis monooxygenase family protein [Bacillus piscicola]|uniref:antibiotic biosynthesis monooxygenase family protein n=1 Tax=Bacillus piscicola TaxID=1632684 RepID=UPI001F09E246|nr:antibiotic biosynthesis monooxygenase family protein [Bacillus piscicola]
MYVVMNELQVPTDAKEAMKARFGKSAENMKDVPGCLDFMFLEEDSENSRQIVFTKWDSKQSYDNWLESSAFKKAHQEKGTSKEKSPASGNELKSFDVIHHL